MKTTTSLARCIAPAIARAQGEPQWLQQLRHTAQQRWQALSPPTLRSEDYRYTNIKPLLAEDWQLVTVPSKLTANDYAALKVEDEHCCLLADGTFIGMQGKSLPQGVECLSLRQALRRGLLAASHWQASTDYLQLLNDVCFHDGVYVHVAAGVKIKQPLHLIFVNGAQASPKAMFSRNIIDVARNAELQVIESHYGLTSDNYLSVVRTVIDVAEGASCALAKFQHEGTGAYHFSAVEGRQGQDTRLGLVNISYGSKLARLDSHVAQVAKGAHCDFRSLYLGKGQQVLDNCSHIEHLAVEGTTQQRVRGIVREQARGIFAGNISVPRQAQRTSAAQLSKNLLFGKDCAVYIKPQLQIEADDVHCSHGATSARIAAADLHYLATRGIDSTTAAQLLCRAHVAELAQDLPIKATQRFFDMVLSDFLRGA